MKNGKKRKLEIKSGFCADGITYCVTVCNAIFQENCFTKINNIIKHFAQGNELFFGFYRIDGLNLTKEEFQKCDREIPIFFKENGEYREVAQEVIDRKGRIKTYSGYLTVAKAEVNDKLYKNLQWILQYYLETVFFIPKISFDEFEDIYRNYMKKPAENYVVKEYTDFLFSFFDSGDFSVTFDPKKYDAKHVCEAIETIIKS